MASDFHKFSFSAFVNTLSGWLPILEIMQTLTTHDQLQPFSSIVAFLSQNVVCKFIATSTLFIDREFQAPMDKVDSF